MVAGAFVLARGLVDDAGADARLEDMKKHPISYLAHEYMNSDWDAFFFSDVAKFEEMNE